MHIRRRLAKGVIPILLLLGTMFGVAPNRAGAGILGTRAAADATTSVIVHYHRFDDNYTNWDLWEWPYQPTNGGGVAYEFDGSDAFGKVAHTQVPGANTMIGLIVRKNDWSDREPPGDRHIPTPNGAAEVWVIQGDPNDYLTLADATTALAEASKTKPVHAFLDGTNWAAVKFNHAIDLSTAKPADFTVKDLVSGGSIAATAVDDLSGGNTGRSDLLKVTLASEPDVTHRLQITFQTYTPIALDERLVLNDPKYTYTGDDLGAIYAPTSTSFKLWAPLATAVTLRLYKDEAGTPLSTTPMLKGPNGTWALSVQGDMKGVYYDYAVTNFGTTTTAVDPYATGIATNGTYGMVVDLPTTDPSGWSGDTYRKTKNPVDATIWETHVRDFSISPDSGMQNKGKYLAFTETNTKTSKGVASGVAHLKRLGITHVELLPIQGCGSIDEISGGQSTPAQKGDYKRYNWCYDPRNYNAPNGAYATTPTGTARITEVKQMVQALHKQRLGVILDVVYNHTNSMDVFNNIVPGYYYRTDYDGNFTNGSGVGNEVAAERPQVRKFIIDSLSYWMKQYHVDGFRFDLMALLGHDTMQQASTALHKINPNTVMLGEPWTGGNSGLVTDNLVTKGVQKNLGLAVFNDDLRNAVANEVFNDNKDYATGDPTKNAAVATGVTGEINYDLTHKGWASKPSEDINYVTSHDNKTLWDRIAAANPNVDEATRIKMDEFSQAIIFTSQGVPYIQSGEEFLRTKGGDSNSYQSGDQVNMLDWNRTSQYASVFNYYSGLVHLRAAHPAFRMTTASMITSHLTFVNDTPQQTIVYKLTGHANKDKWKTITIMYNPNDHAVKLPLGKGTWNVVASGSKVALKAFAKAKKSYSVPAYSAAILYQ